MGVNYAKFGTWSNTSSLRSGLPEEFTKFVAVRIRSEVARRLEIAFIAAVKQSQLNEDAESHMMATTNAVSNTNSFAINLDTRPHSSTGVVSPEVGIDKMKLTFPISPDRGRRMLGLRTIRSEDAPQSSLDWGESHDQSAKFNGYVYVRRDATYWGTAEFNPSRWHDFSGWTCVTASDLERTLESVWSAVEKTFQPAVDMNRASVLRLDITRDFADVRSPDKYLMRLDTNVRAFKNLHRGHHASPTRGGWTLRLSTKNGGSVLLYDKHRETAGRAPQGTLRFEVQMKGWLTTYGTRIRTLADITGESIEHAARGWWERSNFGRPIVSDPDILTEIQNILRGQRNAATMANAVYAYYLRAKNGDEATDLPQSTRRRYESILRRAEDSAGVHGRGSHREQRLDFDRGREVDTDG